MWCQSSMGMISNFQETCYLYQLGSWQFVIVCKLGQIYQLQDWWMGHIHGAFSNIKYNSYGGAWPNAISLNMIIPPWLRCLGFIVNIFFDTYACVIWLASIKRTMQHAISLTHSQPTDMGTRPCECRDHLTLPVCARACAVHPASASVRWRPAKKPPSNILITPVVPHPKQWDNGSLNQQKLQTHHTPSPLQCDEHNVGMVLHPPWPPWLFKSLAVLAYNMTYYVYVYIHKLYLYRYWYPFHVQFPCMVLESNPLITTLQLSSEHQDKLHPGLVKPLRLNAWQQLCYQFQQGQKLKSDFRQWHRCKARLPNQGHRWVRTQVLQIIKV